jgi:chemotaxis protein methyltransferase CheR
MGPGHPRRQHPRRVLTASAPRREARPEAAPPPDPALVGRALEALQGLVGLAPGDVARRRLARPGLPLDAALAAPPDIGHPAWAALVDAVTVQETRLFRNPAQLETLRQAVLPELVARARARNARKLRLLSAGCATGEEAWTLAALGQAALRAAPGLGLEVLGLDLSRPALRMAEAAQFSAGPPDPLRDVPPAFRDCFPPAPGGFGVAPGLRGAVRFARANLLDLAVEPGFDAVLCRNVCIYLTDPARGRVLRRLAGLLHQGGALLLGPTDTVPPGAGLAPWTAETVSIFRNGRDHA